MQRPSFKTLIMETLAFPILSSSCTFLSQLNEGWCQCLFRVLAKLETKQSWKEKFVAIGKLVEQVDKVELEMTRLDKNRLRLRPHSSLI